MQKTGRAGGFTLIELMVVVFVILAILVISLPIITNFAANYRISGAARVIATQLSLARMRAAAGFTQAQLVINTSTGAFQVQWCSTKNTATGGCTTWTSDVPSALYGNCQPAVLTAQCGTQYLPLGVSFVTTFPAGMTTGAGGQNGSTPSQTTAVIFNSRGIAINSSDVLVTNDAIYLTSTGRRYYAITVSAGGKPTLYVYTPSSSPPWKEM